MNGKRTDLEAQVIAAYLDHAERREEAELRRLQRCLAVYCGTCGVVLMLAVGGGCSVALGVVLVAAGAVVWRGA
jgi:hypothetical protein